METVQDTLFVWMAPLGMFAWMAPIGDTFMAMAKSYSGTLRLGEGTVTYDAEVEVSERLPWEDITDEDLQRTAASFTGEQMQARTRGVAGQDRNLSPHSEHWFNRSLPRCKC